MRDKFIIVVAAAVFLSMNLFASDTLSLRKKISAVEKNISAGVIDTTTIAEIRKLVFYFRSYDPALALHYNNVLMEIARKLGDRKFEATLLAERGAYFREQGLLNHALENLKAAADLSDMLGDASGAGWTMLEIGNIYYLLKLYDQSEFYFRKSYELGNKSAHTILKFVSLNNIGLVKRQSGNYAEAKKYFLKADSVNVEKLLPFSLNTLRYIASIEILTGNNNKALEYFDRAVALYNKEQPSANNHAATGVLFETMLNRAELLIELNHFDKALASLDEALKFGEENNLVVESVGHLNKSAELYLKLGNLSSAKRSVEKSLARSKRHGMLLYQSDSYRLLSVIFEKEGNIAAAYSAHKKHKAINDSTFNKELSLLMADLRARVETEKTNQQLRLVEKEKELSDLKIRRQGEYIVALIISFAFVLVLFIGLFNRYSYRKKSLEKIQEINSRLEAANEQLTEINEAKNKLLSVLAHDLRSPHQVILSYSEIICEDYDDLSDEEIKKFAEEINSVCRKHYSFLENLLEWVGMQFQKKEFEKSELSLNDEIEQAVEKLINPAAVKNISIQFAAENEIIFSSNKHALHSILFNLINNSIKFTHSGGKILATASDEDGQIKISIADSGVGMTAEQCDGLFKLEKRNSSKGTMNEKGSGFGLIIVHELIKNLGGSVSVQSEVGKGTTFSIVFNKN